MSPKTVGRIRDPNTTPKIAVAEVNDKKQATYAIENDNLTSFERTCLGASFHKLFADCDEITYVTYNDKEIYQASPVMLMLVARLVPVKMLRTFNVLLLR
ncbi:hypothetical protein PI126_g10589 [Phytophthora idaei]|nr:hypothetical protein PI126_g10589 [Phytophthora idaei]